MNTALLISLALMWLQGAIASGLPSGYAQGVQLLTAAGLSVDSIRFCIVGGIAADAMMAIGALLAAMFMSLRKHYGLLSFVLIATYTVLASFLAPQLWLDPFGALGKNIPLLALSIYFFTQTKEV